MKKIWVPISLYILLELATLSWGIPNPRRMFAYYMDEWHSMQAVRFVWTSGTNNIAGAAHGTMGFYLWTGLWLGPFAVLKVFNPWAIKNAAVALGDQYKMWILLRLSTVIWGSGAMVVLGKIVKDKRVIWLWILAPIWLTLSGIFKYDVAVVFWISVFMWLVLQRKWLWAGLAMGLGMAVKISVAPEIAILIMGYWMLAEKKSWKELFISLVVGGVAFVATGIPDVIMGKGDKWGNLLQVVLGDGPGTTSNYKLGMNFVLWFGVKEFPAIFGMAGYGMAIIGGILALLKKSREDWFVLIGLVMFGGSILTLGIWGGGNRALVLLPWLVVLSAKAVKKIKWRWIMVVLVVWQLWQGVTWWSFRTGTDIRQQASEWINNNIPVGSTIGVENIPAYQRIPDVLVNSFYGPDYGVTGKYKVETVYSDMSEFPEWVVMSDGDYEAQYLVKSSKRDLVTKLENEGYFVAKKWELGEVDPLVWNLTGLVNSPEDITMWRRGRFESLVLD